LTKKSGYPQSCTRACSWPFQFQVQGPRHGKFYPCICCRCSNYRISCCCSCLEAFHAESVLCLPGAAGSTVERMSLSSRAYCSLGRPSQKSTEQGWRDILVVLCRHQCYFAINMQVDLQIVTATHNAAVRAGSCA